MNALLRPSLILAVTVFLTACAPSERPASTQPVEVRRVVTSADAAYFANESTAPLAIATTALASPVLASLAVAPFTVERESTRDAILRTPQSSDVASISDSKSQLKAVGNRTGSPKLNGGNRAVVTAVVAAREQVPSLPLAVVAAAHPRAFTPEQMRVLVQLGESFLAETNPASLSAAVASVDNIAVTPEERWAISSVDSDDRFSAMFGHQAFNAMQLQRAREAYVEAKAR